MVKPKPGASDYERYIQTEALLKLQKEPSALSNPDELMFITVHQSMELWCKVAHFEIQNAVGFLDESNYFRSAKHLKRAADAISYTTKAFPIMLSMAQADYHHIREGLGRGSGRDSPGFQKLLKETRELLWPHLSRALEREKIGNLIEIYKKPHDVKFSGLYAVLDGMLSVDRDFQTFRYLHLQMARTEIGLAVKSLKGIPAARMIDGVIKPFFPELWEVIEDFTEFTNISYG